MLAGRLNDARHRSDHRRASLLAPARGARHAIVKVLRFPAASPTTNDHGLVKLASQKLQVFDDRTERQRGQISQPAYDDDGAEQEE
jgi:hypothetical protein